MNVRQFARRVECWECLGKVCPLTACMLENAFKWTWMDGWVGELAGILAFFFQGGGVVVI